MVYTFFGVLELFSTKNMFNIPIQFASVYQMWCIQKRSPNSMCMASYYASFLLIVSKKYDLLIYTFVCPH